MARVAILVSGVMRSFIDELLPFLERLPPTWHIYCSMPRGATGDRFYNETTSLDKLAKSARIKLLLLDDDIDYKQNRNKNIIIQWRRIYQLYSLLPNGQYDFVIRCRPDIKFECCVEQLVAAVEKIETNTIYIPKGFDIYDIKRSAEACINDQFAFGSYGIMRHYCDTYLRLNDEKEYISEHELFLQLQESNVVIKRPELSYRLLLSRCFTFSVCGDSGSGKSSLSRLIVELLHFDNTLLFETDRYHKWERGAPEYTQYSHLHPEANNLEKLANDAYKLTLGEDIYMFDYDHDTGKFTDHGLIEPKNYLILCGLHTLYKESLRNISDLKIYLDTEQDLKTEWKIARDSAKRGATEEQIRETMRRRQPDFEAFVAPQRSAADLIVRYTGRPDAIGLKLELKNSYSREIQELGKLSTDVHVGPIFTSITFGQVTDTQLLDAAKALGYNGAGLKSAPDGIIQYCILLLTWRY